MCCFQDCRSTDALAQNRRLLSAVVYVSLSMSTIDVSIETPDSAKGLYERSSNRKWKGTSAMALRFSLVSDAVVVRTRLGVRRVVSLEADCKGLLPATGAGGKAALRNGPRNGEMGNCGIAAGRPCLYSLRCACVSILQQTLRYLALLRPVVVGKCVPTSCTSDTVSRRTKQEVVEKLPLLSHFKARYIGRRHDICSI